MERENFSESYKDVYDRILVRGMRWLTVSPRASSLRPMKHILLWMQDLKQLRYFTHDFLLVFEMTDQLRLHIHAVYSVSDKIKEYKVLNKWKVDQMLRVYNGEPEKGFDYLFKDAAFTSEYLEDAPLVLTRDSILGEYKQLKSNKKLRKVAKQYNLDDFLER